MTDDIRLIAFYLPQYHPIPENDLWWGPGFTEWAKVVDAKPLFRGHHQPQLPGSLGFYDLRLPEVRQAQARLAREHGVHGFCYYYYNFSGKRLLERPLDEMLASGQPDFPFCICWANENWTRRWDGLDHEILIRQHYSPENDRQMIRDMIPMLKDPRYIKVKGLPLVMIYRTQLLPDPAATAAIWRAEAAAAGLPGLYLCRVEAVSAPNFEQDPAEIGFDAACEFPPNGTRVADSATLAVDLDPDFAGFIYDYEAAAQEFSARPVPPYRRFHAVMPSWDNTARKGRSAHIAINANPQAYRRWLRTAIDRTRREQAGDERLVFINAWNEWGEGCHLEPDRRYGTAWLEATRQALGVLPATPVKATVEDMAALLQKNADLEDRLSIKQQAVETKRQEVAGLEQRLADLAAARADDRAHADAAVGARDRDIQTLRDALARQIAHVAQADRALAARHQDIVVMRDLVTNRYATIARLNRDIETMSQELEVRHAAIEQRDQRLLALYSSTSWKFSVPVRKIGALLHSLRVRFGKSTPSSSPSAPPDRVVVDTLQPPEIARPIDIDHSLAVPFTFAARPSGIRVAAVAHLYYEEFACEFRSYLENVPGALDVFVSTSDAFKAQAIERVFAGWDKGVVEVRVVPNCGRDIAPKLVAFADIYDRYDYVVLIHGKRSLHAGYLARWRLFFLESLLGTPEVVASILTAFAANPKLGMIAAQHFEPIRHWINWGHNFPLAKKLADRMGMSLDERDPLDFPSGSMFWARTAALRPLLDLKLQNADFGIESNQLDGTLAHAIEHVFFHVCEHAGFDWIKIARPEIYEQTPAIIRASSEVNLAAFFERYVFRLLAPGEVKPRSVGVPPISDVAPGLQGLIRRHALGLPGCPAPGTRVAIGIVTFNNGAEELASSLAAAEIALRTAGLASAGQIFLIDNGTPTADPVSAENSVTRLESCGNIGFGRAQNKLMRRAFSSGHDIFIAINPDGLLHPDAVGELVRVVQATQGKALVEALQFPLEHPKPYDMETLDTPWVSGACLAISKSIFESTGGFDEDFFMYCEDVDLSWRARSLGYALKICPRALFLHAVSNRDMSSATLQMIYESGVLLARKWGSPKFEKWLEGELKARGKSLPARRPEMVPEEWRRFADFSHQFSFSEPRW